MIFLCNWNIATEAAFETFNESDCALIGILIKLSTFSLVNLLRPFPSEPSIKATFPVSFSSS